MASTLGVNEYLGKPYQEKDLLSAIERFLRGEGAEVHAVDELYSLLVPLGATRLILPLRLRGGGRELHAGAARAERQGALAHRLAGVERSEIPVISFEGACGLDCPHPTGRVRAVVIRCPRHAAGSGALCR
jgi:hypothetical protein